MQDHVSQVDTAEDHAESAGYHEQDADDHRLTATVRADDRRGTVGVVRHVRDYDLLLRLRALHRHQWLADHTRTHT